MRKRIASEILGACSVVASTVVAMIWPTLDPAFGIPILVLCGIGAMASLAIYFWPPGGKGGGSPRHWMMLPSVFRYLGHGSKWSITKCQSDPGKWKSQAEREIREQLRHGDFVAWAKVAGENRYERDPIGSEEWSTINLPLDVVIDRHVPFAVPNHRAGVYDDVALDAASVYKIWPRWSRWTRLRRKLIKSPKSLAELTGEIAAWRRSNEEWTPDDRFYWEEPK